MNAGSQWRKCSRRSAVLATLTGVAFLGLGSRARADDPAPGNQPEAVQSEADAKGKTKFDFIDEMIRDAWEQSSVKKSSLATDEEFLRRAYLDVLGRIPNIDEASAFLRSRESGKRAKLVEYLLNQPDYAKNFGTLWKVLLIGRKRPARGVDRRSPGRPGSAASSTRAARGTRSCMT